MWQLTHLTLILISLTRTNALDKHRLEFDALDCRTPKGVIRSKVDSLCTHSQNTVEGLPQSVHILQFDQTRVLEAVTCELKKTKILAYCGSFSHTKIYEPIDVLRNEPISHDICVQAHKTHLYTREDGKQAMITENRSYIYKYIEHGQLTTSPSNIKCEGEQFSIHGKMRSNMLSLVTAQFTIHKVSIEADPDKGIRDLDSGYKLPVHCMADRYCYIYGRMYVILSPKDACPLYLIRSLTMVETKYKGTDKEDHVALVSHDHQVILERKTEFHLSGQCHGYPSVYNTNYDQIKVVVNRTSTKMTSLKPYNLDLSLQTQILHDYSNYRAENLVDSKLDEVLHNLCETNKFGLDAIERDPFRSNYLLQRTGEVYVRFQCVKVTVIARTGDNVGGKCYRDALPVFMGKEKLLLVANTRMLLDMKDGEITSCSAQFPPLLFSKSGQILTANPSVKVVNVTLTAMGSAIYPTHERVEHESAAHFALYTEEELKDFNFLLHFGRTKQAVLSELTGKYCSGQNCGSVSHHQFGESFDINRLKNQLVETLDVTRHLKNILAHAGRIGGCAFLVYTVFKVICKCTDIYHLYTTRNTTLRFAVRANLHRDREINELILSQTRDNLELGGHDPEIKTS